MIEVKKFVFTVSLCAMLAVNPVLAFAADEYDYTGEDLKTNHYESFVIDTATEGVAGVKYVNRVVEAAGNAAAHAEEHAAAAGEYAISAKDSADDAQAAAGEAKEAAEKAEGSLSGKVDVNQKPEDKNKAMVTDENGSVYPGYITSDMITAKGEEATVLLVQGTGTDVRAVWGQVSSAGIADGAITSDKIADWAVTADKMDFDIMEAGMPLVMEWDFKKNTTGLAFGVGSVFPSGIAAGDENGVALVSQKFIDSSGNSKYMTEWGQVGTAGIADDAVTIDKIKGSESGTSGVMVTDGYGDATWTKVNAGMIADGAVTPDKIEGSSSEWGVLWSNGRDSVAWGKVSAGLIDDGAVTTSTIYDGAVTPDKISKSETGWVTSDMITKSETGWVTPDMIEGSSSEMGVLLSSGSGGVKWGKVTSDMIDDGALTIDKIKDSEDGMSGVIATNGYGEVTWTKVNAAMIDDGAVTTDKIPASFVDGGGDIHYANKGSALVSTDGNGTAGWGQVSGAGIADGAVTADKILDGTIKNADIAEDAAIAQSKIDGLGADLDLKEDKANKLKTTDITEITESNRDTLYPSVGKVQSMLPVVNDAVLTIQKNGVSVGSFNANASDNETINIEVPTGALASQDSVLSSQLPEATATEKGAVLKLATWKQVQEMADAGTLTEEIANAAVPSYKMITDLQSSINESVDERIGGKQDTSTADYQMGNKDGGWTTMTVAQQDALNSTITAAKVSTYDGYETKKQDRIDDLETIRSGAKLGETAVQPGSLGALASLNVVDTDQITGGAVTTDKIKGSSSVTGVLWSDGADSVEWGKVSAGMIADGAVTTDKINGSSSVTGVLWTDGSGSAKWGQVTSDMIKGSSSVTGVLWTDGFGGVKWGQVTSDMIEGPSSVTGVLWSDGSGSAKWGQVSAGMIADGAVTADKILAKDGSYNTTGVLMGDGNGGAKWGEVTNIAGGAVREHHIDNGAVTTYKIKGSSSEMGVLWTNGSGSVKWGKVTSGMIADNAVAAEKIAAGYVDGSGNYQNARKGHVLVSTDGNGTAGWGQISGAGIADGAVTPDKIKGGTSGVMVTDGSGYVAWGKVMPDMIDLGDYSGMSGVIVTDGGGSVAWGKVGADMIAPRAVGISQTNGVVGAVPVGSADAPTSYGKFWID